MFQGIYCLLQLIEMSIGMYLIHLVYPELRSNSKVFKGFVGISFILLATIHIFNAWDSYISISAIAIFGLLFAALYCVFFKANYLVVSMWWILYEVNISFLRLPVMIIRGLWTGEDLGKINRGSRNVVELVVCAFLVMLLAWVAVRVKSNQEIFRKLLLAKRRLLLIIAIIQILLLTYNMILGRRGFQSTDLVVNIMLIICAALAMECFVVYIVYKNNQAEYALLNKIQDVSQSHNKALEEFYEYSNQRLHDVKHDLMYAINCLDKGEIANAQSCIAGYLEGIEKTSNQIWTGVPFLDFVLNYKKIKMDEKNITFSLEFDLYKYPFQEEEFGVILGNLLDNAIEAAELCEQGKRNILLRLCNKNDIFLLSVRNSSTRMPSRKNGDFVTSKRDKKLHGFGTVNVRTIVERYSGNIDFKYDNSYFEVNILV